jgi:hypothetical protein
MALGEAQSPGRGRDDRLAQLFIEFEAEPV